MALGAISALKEAGRTDVIVGGFDSSPDAAAAVADGSMAYTALQPVAIYATAAVTQADASLKTGKTGVATEKQTFDCFLINKDNIAKYGSFSINPNQITGPWLSLRIQRNVIRVTARPTTSQIAVMIATPARSHAPCSREAKSSGRKTERMPCAIHVSGKTLATAGSRSGSCAKPR